MRLSLFLYLSSQAAIVAVLAWALLTSNDNDRITAWSTAASITALCCFCTFLNTGSRWI